MNVQDMSEQRNIDAEAPFYVAEWYVDPATCRITKDEQQHKLELKTMTVLVCLAQQQGQVISRDVLKEKAWPDMVVGYDSLASAIIKLRKAFGDNEKNSELIETVPKKGYRLICPVSTMSAALASDSENSRSTTENSGPGSRKSVSRKSRSSESESSKAQSTVATPDVSKIAIIIIAAAFAVAALLPVYVQFTSETGEPDKSSISTGRMVTYGEILFNKRDYKGAIKYFTEALNANPDREESRIWLAAAYANIGDIEEAKWQLEQVKINGGELSLKRLEKVISFKGPEQRKAFIDGLYKAGIEN